MDALDYANWGIYKATENFKGSEKSGYMDDEGTDSNHNDRMIIDDDDVQIGDNGGSTDINSQDNKLNAQSFDPQSDNAKWAAYMKELGINDKLPSLLKREDIVYKSFSSLDAANDFYFLYGRLMGFSVRLGQKRKRNGEVRIRTWLCSKEGERQKKHLQRIDRVREPQQLTREGCMVQFRVNVCKKTSQWIVKEFITDHSHCLAIASHVNFLRSNRKIVKGIQAKAKAMRRAGIKTSRIISYMAQLAWGYDKVGFWPKDLHNRMADIPEIELADSDASKALGYLQHKADHDVGFFAKFTYDEDMRLLNLFWADSRSQEDYKVFGDVLAFDTTYKTNVYSRPLFVLVGINRHFRTTVFGFALLVDETIESYNWALATFLDCMGRKKPYTVITDGDLAMRSAILKLMPDTVHRLCIWHIQRNAISHVKDPNFLPWLTKLMFRQYSEDKFHREWEAGVANFGLQHNEWVQSMYERRRMWADTFLRGHFFGGQLSTQRCEGMNAFLKTKVKMSTKLADFVCHMDLGISWLRLNENKEDFNSTHTKPVLGATNMHAIEAQAADIFTRQMFFQVRDEMNKEGSYFVTELYEKGDTVHIQLTKYGNDKKTRHVRKTKSTNCFACDCNLYPSKGVPCKHIFSSIKALQMTKLPDSLIMSRWLKIEKGGNFENWSNERSLGSTLACSDEFSRYGIVSAKASDIAYYASVSASLHKVAVSELEKLTALLKGLH